MDQRQELTPEMQIFLIASDVEEAKTMIKALRGTVGEIHIALVGDKDKPGIFEELRRLREHTHPELEAQVAELRSSMRVYIARAGGLAVGAVTVLEVALRLVFHV